MIYGVGRSTEIAFRDVEPGLINMLFGGVVSGEVGYRAYCEAVGGRAFNGDALPQWADVPERIRSAWDRAAYAIVEASCQEADGSGRRCCVDGCGCGG